jgi:hypothetical protein
VINKETIDEFATMAAELLRRGKEQGDRLASMPGAARQATRGYLNSQELYEGVLAELQQRSKIAKAAAKKRRAANRPAKQLKLRFR